MLSRSNRKTAAYNHPNKWRDYQSQLKKKDGTRRSYRRIPFYAALLCLLVLAGNAVFALLDKSLEVDQKSISLIFNDGQIDQFNKRTLKKIVRQCSLATCPEKNVELSDSGFTYQVKSSIMNSLQEFIIDHIDRKNSRHFGFVAMEPATGRILSMVSYDRNSKNPNVCITPDYPAASLFKIITAAAVIEKCGFNASTPVNFNDGKYTLYKPQLKERINKYTNYMTFGESFAGSVNPVFGKIGQNRLGKSTLEDYAAAFGFNRKFDFEIPLKPSTISISDTPYNWAEIASGFNNDTLISPLHGAMVVSSIVNNGKLVEPTIIDKVNKQDQVLYHQSPTLVSDVISPSTSAILKKIMSKTVISGTASKSFSRFEKDRVLSKLSIGGKTGSINNNAEHIKYDWFAGFAEEKNGSNKIVVSVLVVHQDKIGTRAASYSRMAIKEYFKNYYADINEQRKKNSAAL